MFFFDIASDYSQIENLNKMRNIHSGVVEYVLILFVGVYLAFEGLFVQKKLFFEYVQKILGIAY